ncbi:hypothetical protein MTO96_004737 [Rhipicephalus appendiculatus]
MERCVISVHEDILHIEEMRVPTNQCCGTVNLSSAREQDIKRRSGQSPSAVLHQLRVVSTATRETRCPALPPPVAWCCCFLLQAALAFPDYKDLRDLYELMAKGEQEGSGHAMERKAGYTPSLRLRFGRRSDPAWSEARTWDAQRTV